LRPLTHPDDLRRVAYGKSLTELRAVRYDQRFNSIGTPDQHDTQIRIFAQRA
jgi:hypothetical protein